jgi:hypothetical protein
MKSKIFVLILIILPMIIFSGCSSSKNWTHVGKWKAADNSTIEFKPDNTFVATYFTYQDEGKWDCNDYSSMSSIGTGGCTITSKNGNIQKFWILKDSDKITNSSNHFEYSRLN